MDRGTSPYSFALQSQNVSFGYTPRLLVRGRSVHLQKDPLILSTLGESLSALPLIRHLLSSNHAREVILTTSTASARKLLPTLLPKVRPVMFCPASLGLFLGTSSYLVSRTHTASSHRSISPDMLTGFSTTGSRGVGIVPRTMLRYLHNSHPNLICAPQGSDMD